MEARAQIVLIDDDPSWLETLSDYLRSNGFAVLCATNAVHGLSLVREGNVALVISDYHMPGMDGLELVSLLNRQHRDIAVLMLSSEEESRLHANAMAAGARGFLAKSVRPRVLLRRIRQIVEAACQARGRASMLRPWQRLLPSPEMIYRRRCS
jgi:DNA-binding response OmpR family regulator